MDLKKKKVLEFLDSGEETFPEDFTYHMQDYHEYLNTGDCDNKENLYAFKLHEDPYKKEIVEALLLSDANLEEVQTVFGVPVESLKCYSELFFDTNSFYTRLDKLSYVENYKYKFGRELKVRAMSLGPEFIYFTYGKVSPTTETQKTLLKKMFLSSAYKAMEMNFNSINSQTTKASVEMAKIMIRSYESMEKLLKDGDNAGEQLLAIMTDRTLTLTADARNLRITTEDLI